MSSLRMRWLFLLVLCIGGSAARAELIDNLDGTITDTASGLMWLKNANAAGQMDWATAMAWAANLDYAGHVDWRLPSGANRDGSVCDSSPAGANCTGTEFATLYFGQTIRAGLSGPFQSLQWGSYWTSTDLPGDSSRAMAQDFVDGGQNPLDKSGTFFAWAVRDSPVPSPVEVLYGVVERGANRGALVTIDPSSATVSIVANTGLEQPCGLTFDRTRGLMYISECFGQSPLRTVDMRTAATAPLSSATPSINQIAHRHIDDYIYGVDLSLTLSRVDAPTGGSIHEIVGMISRQSIGGLAVRFSDGRLFAVGYSSLGSNQVLMTFRTSPLPGAVDTEIGPVDAGGITGLAFHPDGRLFATDGSSLLTLNAESGAVLSSKPFTGASVGPISGLAVKSATVPAPTDVWIRDCPEDKGSVPSSPRPCGQWWRSPDIWIDNDDDDVPDSLVTGQTNIVKVSVRNRGPGPALGTTVHLYAMPMPKPTLPRISFADRPRRIGAVVLDLKSLRRRNVQTISFPWPAQTLPASGTHWCLMVILSHPQDLPRKPTGGPISDNNVAVWCTRRPL